MSYQEFLSFERRGAVGIVRLARPEKLNTISAPFYEAMIELQQTEIVGDHDLRAIALLADGRHFSAGIDLNYAKAGDRQAGAQPLRRLSLAAGLPLLERVQPAGRGRHPGACMGTAIELITACDIRIAADNAEFSWWRSTVGISTDLRRHDPPDQAHRPRHDKAAGHDMRGYRRAGGRAHPALWSAW
ncbi:MAG: enoyl-CoA hydratase/isomerase family protein [Oscillospiraceae bacterium]